MTNNTELKRLFAAMADQRNQLLKELSAGPLENWHKAPEGAWTSLEILQHLYLSESGILKLLQKQVLKPATEFHTVNFKNKYRSTLLNLSLISTLSFKAPTVVSHFERNMTLEELSQEWHNFETAMKLLLADFPETLKNKVIFRHPRAGWITIKGTINFMRFHQLHHIRQIRERAGIKKG